MRKIATLLSKLLSILLFPLVIPTVGMVLFTMAYSQEVHELSRIQVIILLACTVLFTFIVPMVKLLLLRRQGKIKDLYIDIREQRNEAYFSTFCYFLLWLLTMGIVAHGAYFLMWTCIGATIAIGIVRLVNTRWKISAHLTAMGGLLGGVINFSIGTGVDETWLVIIVLVVSWLLMLARIYLNAHTAEQVIAGFLLGLFCTVTPCIIQYGIA